MDGAKSVPLEEEKLTTPSSEFLGKVLAWKPDWKNFCSMDVAPHGFDLRIHIPSPSGNPDLAITVWFANGENDLSLAFGLWHCHGAVAFESSDLEWTEWTILEGIQMVVRGDIVNFEDAADPGKLKGAIYLPSMFQLEDELISKFDSGAILIRSWDGSKDKKITLGSLA